MEDRTHALEQLIADVENCIRSAENANYRETAALLRIAKIDLITRVNGISGEELEAFLFALESELCIQEHLEPARVRKAARGRTQKKLSSSMF